MDSSETNTSPDNLKIYHNTSGTVANNFGTSIGFFSETTTTTDAFNNRISSLWSNATHATRLSLLKFTGNNSGTDNEILGLFGDKKIYTYGIHNNPVMVGTTGSTQRIGSGEYVPTVAGISWSLAVLTGLCAQWLRVGNVVTVSGQFTVTPDNSPPGGLGSIQIPVPVATAANDSCQISGVAAAYDITAGTTGVSGVVISYNNGTSYDARVDMYFPTNNQYSVRYHFTYLVE